MRCGRLGGRRRSLLGAALRGLLWGLLDRLPGGVPRGSSGRLFRGTPWRLLTGLGATAGALRRWLLAGRLPTLLLTVRFLWLLGVSVGV